MILELSASHKSAIALIGAGEEEEGGGQSQPCLSSATNPRQNSGSLFTSLEVVGREILHCVYAPLTTTGHHLCRSGRAIAEYW